MTSMLIFLLVLGIVVFGPKKTIEMAQAVGQAGAGLKEVGGAWLASLMTPEAAATASSVSPTVKRP